MAYDSIRRIYLFETLRELGMPNKLTRLVRMALHKTRNKVKVQNELSREFLVNQGLKQGDALSCVLFNLTLERWVRAIKIREQGTMRSFLNATSNRAGNFFNQGLQVLAGKWTLPNTAEPQAVWTFSWSANIVRNKKCTYPLAWTTGEKVAKQLLSNQPVGRPRKRWLNDVEDDLVQLRVWDWRRVALDRGAWRDVVEGARVLHGLCSATVNK